MIILLQSLAVGIGAFFGGALRSLLSTVLNLSDNTYPWGTLMANIIGSCFLGIVTEAIVLSDLTSTTQLVTAIGFSGGLTTFSTFTLEVFKMFKKRNVSVGMVYWIGTVLVCLLAFVVGIFIKKVI